VKLLLVDFQKQLIHTHCSYHTVKHAAHVIHIVICTGKLPLHSSWL